MSNSSGKKKSDLVRSIPVGKNTVGVAEIEGNKSVSFINLYFVANWMSSRPTSSPPPSC